MLQDLRENYDLSTLMKKDLKDNPIDQFNVWMKYAIEQEITEPNAMTLATVDANGRPSARIVLLKEVTEKGFIFYTNYGSHKAKQMQQNPNVALVFNWLDLHKQIRIEGKVVKISPEKSADYFKSRPKDSQIGAWTSPQSTVISSRTELEDKKRELEEQYSDTEQLPLPSNWGGYLVEPVLIEFWQGRPSRLHDRFRFKLQEDGNWEIDRLAP